MARFTYVTTLSLAVAVVAAFTLLSMRERIHQPLRAEMAGALAE